MARKGLIIKILMIEMEYTTQNLLLILGLIIVAYIIIKSLLKILQKRKRILLSRRIKNKADRKFNKLLNKFKRKNKRNPTKNELFRIVISASHITIRQRGHKGHWGRPKIRKYLLEKHHIVKEFRMH